MTPGVTGGEPIGRLQLPRMGVVDVTMNGEDDVSHYLFEYFGSCRGGLGPGALTGVLAQIRKGYSLPVSGVGV